MSRPLDGYPTSWGSSRTSIMGVAGPASYTQVSDGTAPAVATGGQTIRASDFGLKYFDYVGGGQSDTGVNYVLAIPGAPSGSGPKGACDTYTLRWKVQATNAEVAALVNLSTEVVRLLIVGPK